MKNAWEVSGKLLLALASIVIIGFRPRRTHGHIFFSRQKIWEEDIETNLRKTGCGDMQLRPLRLSRVVC
jgi:hypothetical protein